MEAYLLEWLNLGLRWAHVIVGIAWIGASFYFIWLDNHLEPSQAPGIAGELWRTKSFQTTASAREAFPSQTR